MVIKESQRGEPGSQKGGAGEPDGGAGEPEGEPGSQSVAHLASGSRGAREPGSHQQCIRATKYYLA